MTAREEIEHRNLYVKRRSSFTSSIYNQRDVKTRCATSVPHLHDSDPSTSDSLPPQRAKRQKSISVCVGCVQLENERRYPRTLNDFQFISPQLLTMNDFELQTIRPVALSTSETFNEPPPFYIYRPVNTPYQKKLDAKPSNRFKAFVKRRKHLFIAWTFGIIAVTLCIIVIALQTKGDIH